MKNSMTHIYDKWFRVPRLDGQDAESEECDEARHAAHRNRASIVVCLLVIAAYSISGWMASVWLLASSVATYSWMKFDNTETRKASYACVGTACLSLILVVFFALSANNRANPSGDPEGELPSAQLKSG